MKGGSLFSKKFNEQLSKVGIGSSIGDVKTSMLTEAEYQALNGPTWVLMDGRDVVGSDLAILKTGSNVTPHNVPDARGQFLRGLDPSGSVDPDGVSRNVGDTQDDAFQGHFHNWLIGQSSTSVNTGASPNSSPANSVPMTNYITGGKTNYETDEVNGIPRVSEETRPKNITVNIFIKINW
jgi:hypothetical protein